MSKTQSKIETIKTLLYAEELDKQTQGLQELEKLVRQNDPEAIFEYASLFEHGYLVEKDYHEALALYTKLAELGYGYAQNKMGLLYDEGILVEKDEVKANEWFWKAASQGDSYGQLNMGESYELGICVEVDLQKAWDYYTEAAKQNNPDAQYRIGDFYDHGILVNKDPAKAISWYLYAAKQNHVPAILALYKHYSEGIGVEKDEAKAKELYERALYLDHDQVQAYKDNLLQDLLKELDELTGLQSVKDQIHKRVAMIQVELAAKKAGASRKNQPTSLHMIFVGNPGTGKTTIARLVGKIYHALGIIESGDRFIECDRASLVGQYIGETAQKVHQKVDEALGGILFVDEAYSLYRAGDNQDFGKEAIDTLIKCMEDNRDNLVVILAGYTDLIDDFIEHANPGLKSRFRTRITFEDYSVEEMVQIFYQMVNSYGMHIEDGLEDFVYQLIQERSQIDNFGNARGVRNLLEDVIDANNMRLSQLLNQGNQIDFDSITKEDLLEGMKA